MCIFMIYLFFIFFSVKRKHNRQASKQTFKLFLARCLEKNISLEKDNFPF